MVDRRFRLNAIVILFICRVDVDAFEIERFHIDNFRGHFIAQTFTRGVHQHAVVLVDSPGEHSSEPQLRGVLALSFNRTRRVQRHEQFAFRVVEVIRIGHLVGIDVETVAAFLVFQVQVVINNVIPFGGTGFEGTGGSTGTRVIGAFQRRQRFQLNAAAIAGITGIANVNAICREAFGQQMVDDGIDRPAAFFQRVQVSVMRQGFRPRRTEEVIGHHVDAVQTGLQQRFHVGVIEGLHYRGAGNGDFDVAQTG